MITTLLALPALKGTHSAEKMMSRANRIFELVRGCLDQRTSRPAASSVRRRGVKTTAQLS